MFYNQPKYKARRTPKQMVPKAGPVTVTRNGDTTVVPAYTIRQAEQIVKVGDVRLERRKKKAAKKK